jgi:lipopolysaccharide export system permease protein
MQTIRRLLYEDIVWATSFVALAFLSLFLFLDLVEGLSNAGQQGLTVWHAFAQGLLQMPGHFYELAPIAVLIGTIFVLARMAQSSEFTILRTSGLSPARALRLLASLGLIFAALTFVVGDYLAPWSEQLATVLQGKHSGGGTLGRAGVWLKDKTLSAVQGRERSYSVHVGSAIDPQRLGDIRIFEFDTDGRLTRRISARQASIGKSAVWHLQQVHISLWETSPEQAAATSAQARMQEQDLAQLAWPSSLSPGVVAAAVLPAGSMSTLDLHRYIAHLSDNEQAASRYQIQFWRRALYPLACLVMVMLALPFAYLNARRGGISIKVFSGIVLGISFVLLNNVFAHVGLLYNWAPWLAAATPSVVYLLMSLSAFAWLVRYR